ncbi:MAG: hypothetical protein IIY86_04995, partial [Lachnospiraceae bacterium]|nr:hypothetical protein [Lachnospiraceae bacterium]
MKSCLRRSLLTAVFLIVMLLMAGQAVFADDDSITVTLHMGGPADNADVVFTMEKGGRLYPHNVLDQIEQKGFSQETNDYYMYGYGEKEEYLSEQAFLNGKAWRFSLDSSMQYWQDVELYALWHEKIKNVEITV